MPSKYKTYHKRSVFILLMSNQITRYLINNIGLIRINKKRINKNRLKSPYLPISLNIIKAHGDGCNWLPARPVARHELTQAVLGLP